MAEYAQQPLLQVVDTETGEVSEIDDCPRCAARVEALDAAGARIKRLKGRITELLQEAEEGHEAFPNFKRCFDYWKDRCNHPRTKYEIDDFKLWLPHFTKYGMEKCLRAVDGAAYDANRRQRRNGSWNVFNDWELIHRDRPHFTEFVNKAPYHKPKPEHLSAVSKAILWLHPDWDYDQVTAEAKTKVRRWAT